MTTYNLRIEMAADTAANWTSNDPTLGQGEWGLETDTRKFKIGDGATAWTSLAYAVGTVAFTNSFNDLANKPTYMRAAVEDVTALAAIPEADCADGMSVLVMNIGAFWYYDALENGTDGDAIFPDDDGDGVGAWRILDILRINLTGVVLTNNLPIANLGGNSGTGDTTKFLNQKGLWAVPSGAFTYDTADPVAAPGSVGVFLMNTSTGALFYSTGTGDVSDWFRIIAGVDIVADSDVIEICLFNASENVTTGDKAGNQLIRVPAKFNGWKVTNVEIWHDTTGVTGQTDVQLANVTQAVDVLSTKATVVAGDLDSTDASSTTGVPNGSNNTLAEGDKLRLDVDAVTSGTAPKGLWAEITVTAPTS